MSPCGGRVHGTCPLWETLRELVCAAVFLTPWNLRL